MSSSGTPTGPTDFTLGESDRKNLLDAKDGLLDRDLIAQVEKIIAKQRSADDLGLGDYVPYEGKTIREVIDDYVLIRGDLVDREDPYARAQLASIVEGRIERAVADARAQFAALAAEWTCNCGGPSPEGHHEMHCDSYYGDRLRDLLHRGARA